MFPPHVWEPHRRELGMEKKHVRYFNVVDAGKCQQRICMYKKHHEGTK